MNCATCQHRQRSTCTLHRSRVRKANAACQDYVGVRTTALAVLKFNSMFSRWIEELHPEPGQVVIRFRKGTPMGVKQSVGYVLSPGCQSINQHKAA